MNRSVNNKRIAKNTMLLYVRMFLIMGVSLYSSRIVLKALGAEDFGIYGVVSGVVLMLGFLTSSLARASSRFITYSLGEDTNEAGKPRKVFSTIFWIHLALAVALFLLSETIGLYFVKYKLVIPIGREDAALGAYQLFLLVALLSIFNIPNHSLIIAQEHMGALAYMSIVEALGKLLIAFLLLNATYDRLILYASLCCFIQLLVTIGYAVYTRKKFPTITAGSKSFDRQIFKEMFSYSLWSVSGNVAVLGYTQGINVLLNLFFGPIVNAARSTSAQVQGAIDNFVNSFQMAITPQIIKSYASQDLAYTRQLVVASSKFGFYLTLLLVTPIVLCMRSILVIWLDDVPPNTEELLFVLLLVQLILPLKIPLTNAIQATGDIKKFQVYDSLILLMLLPISYFFLKWLHISPQQVMFVYLSLELIAQLVRTIIVLPRIEMNYREYFLKTILPCFMVFALATLLFMYFYELGVRTLSLLEVLGIAALVDIGLFLSILLLGLNVSERSFLWRYAKRVSKICKGRD